VNRFERYLKATRGQLGFSSQSALVAFVRPAYDLLLEVCYGQTGLERRIHGEQPMRLRPRYRSIAEDAEPAAFAALRSRARTGAVVLDIGANVGVFSLLLARWVGTSGRVYAFEPAPEAARALKDHIALNHLTGQIEVIVWAVSGVSGDATFYAHKYSGENSLSACHQERVPEAKAIRVPVTTVDDFCSARGIAPTLLKIDIEGFELHALRGAKKTLSRHRPPVVVEMHPMSWHEMGVRREELASLLVEVGYIAIPLSGQADSLAEYGHVVLEPIH